MKILLLHLSDIHFNSHNNPVSDRVASIRGALQEMALDCSACFIVMSGDVAWSGQEAEYQQAHTFFDELKAALQALRPWRVEEVFIPGNHDCVLPDPDPLREVVLQAILTDVKSPYRPAGPLIEQCLKAQESYFEFYSRRTGRTLSSVEKLCTTQTFEVDGRKFRFECYNSAWMSRRRENPGQLLIPLGQAAPGEPVDLVVTMFHHPYNWFNPDNRRAFLKEVEARSDLVMTGHEHVSEQYDKITLDKTNLSYFEGAVLQENGKPNDSGFNAMVVDFEKRERQITLFLWSDDHYASNHKGDWESFDRNVRLARARFENTPEFVGFLHDVGAPFTHSAKPNLCLPDIFVYPDCDERNYDGDDSNNVALRRIAGKNLVSYALENHHVLFLGSESCGKSALGRTLLCDLQKQKIVPLWLDGIHLGAPDASAFGRTLDSAVEKQYGPEMVERYQQMDAAQKAVLVDNFHLVKFNPTVQSTLISHLKERFGRVILLADEVLHLKELVHKREQENVLLSFNHCEMLPFGYRNRGELIEKWVALGREHLTDHAETTHRIKEAENLVTTLLGKSLLPGYPIFVLTILQQYEAHSVPDTPSGSFGYYYEFLIFDALRKAQEHRSKRIPLDLVYAFTSYLAYWMFDQEVKVVGQDEFAQVVKQYQQQQKLDFSSQDMLRILQESAMLRLNSNGQYKFQYRYSSYYFIARFIKDNLYTQSYEQVLRERIDHMIEKIYVEDFANIVIFLVYLTRDEKTITGILAKSKTLFAQHEPCNLTDHVGVIKRLKTTPPPVRLTQGANADNRENHRQKLDDDERNNRGYGHDDSNMGEDGTIEQELDRQHREAISYNMALKTLQTLGQILRNFPGTLSGDLKVEITKESYSLGMRVLRSMFTLVENNLEGFQELIYGLLCEVEDPKTEEERKKVALRTDSVIYAILNDTSHAMVKRISFAVGSELLKPTYEQVSDEKMPVAVDMIHTAIHLDHFTHFPDKAVIALYERLDKHPFAAAILKRMVRDYFYLYPVDRGIRQSVCARLQIKVDIVKALNPSHQE